MWATRPLACRSFGHLTMDCSVPPSCLAASLHTLEGSAQRRHRSPTRPRPRPCSRSYRGCADPCDGHADKETILSPNYRKLSPHVYWMLHHMRAEFSIPDQSGFSTFDEFGDLVSLSAWYLGQPPNLSTEPVQQQKPVASVPLRHS